MAVNFAAYLPSRKEAIAGFLTGFFVFLILLLAAYNFAEPLPKGPSAVGSITISTEISGGKNYTPLPANWQEYTEIYEGMRLPFVNARGQRSFDLYKRPFNTSILTQAVRPKLAILVMGLGYDGQLTKAVLASLPPEAGIAIRPEAPYLEQLYPIIATERRELWLHMPSENQKQSINEGLNPLVTQSPVSNNLQLLYKNLSAMHYYVGIAFTPGSLFPSSAEDFTPIIDELGSRGLGIVIPDSNPSLSTIQTAANAKTPLVSSSFSVNEAPLPDNIRSQMDDALGSARTSGQAFVIFPEINEKMMGVVKEWLSLNKDQLTLVPPSALAN